ICNMRIFRSADGGISWNETASLFRDNTFSWIVKLQVDPQDTDTVYVITDTNDALDMFRSTDGGATWTALQGGAWDIVIDPRETNAIYIASGGVSRSTDGGASWETMNEGLPNSFVRTLVVDPQDSKTIYAGTGGG